MGCVLLQRTGNALLHNAVSLVTYVPAVASQTWCIQLSRVPPVNIVYNETYLLTPWGRVFLEKLTGFAASQESGLPNSTEMRSCSSFSVSWVPAVPYQDVLHSSGKEFRVRG